MPGHTQAEGKQGNNVGGSVWANPSMLLNPGYLLTPSTRACPLFYAYKLFPTLSLSLYDPPYPTRKCSVPPLGHFGRVSFGFGGVQHSWRSLPAFSTCTLPVASYPIPASLHSSLTSSLPHIPVLHCTPLRPLSRMPSLPTHLPASSLFFRLSGS